MADNLALAQEWFAAARSDYQYAQVGLKEEVVFPQVAFLSQQIAEKFLKGFLVLNNVEPPLAHELPKLLDECVKIKPELEQLRDACELLAGFYIETRYPPDIPNYSKKDIKEAFAKARLVKETIEKILSTDAHTSGQALLIILLLMSVALTIGLASLSRSTTDIRLSVQEEESARVFSVAEAGIEESLRLGAAQDVTLTVGGAQITARVTSTTMGGENSFVFPQPVAGGDTQTIWLIGHDSGGNLDPTVVFGGDSLDLYWGNEGQAADQPTTPALEVMVIYKSGTEFKVQRAAFDPNSSRAGSNGFDNARVEMGAYSLAGRTFRFRVSNYALPSNPYAIRLKLIYNNGSGGTAQILGAADSGGTNSLPAQGACYQSTATMPTSGITRSIQQCQTYKSPPAIFDYALYSSGDLVK